MKEIIVRGLIEINTKDMAKSEYVPFVDYQTKKQKRKGEVINLKLKLK